MAQKGITEIQLNAINFTQFLSLSHRVKAQSADICSKLKYLYTRPTAVVDGESVSFCALLSGVGRHFYFITLHGNGNNLKIKWAILGRMWRIFSDAKLRLKRAEAMLRRPTHSYEF